MECLVTSEILTSIADTIREVYGTSQKYQLSEMTDAILSMSVQMPPILIERTSSIYENNSVSYIGSYALTSYTALTSARFNNAKRVYENAFAGCTNLSTIHLPMVNAIRGSAFANCQKLESMYLLGSTIPTITNSDVFVNTPIRVSSYLSNRYGSIFVPESLVSAYKAASGWSTISARITAYVPSE